MEEVALCVDDCSELEDSVAAFVNLLFIKTLEVQRFYHLEAIKKPKNDASPKLDSAGSRCM